MAAIRIQDNEFMLQCEFWENEKAKAAPERKFNKKAGAWILPFTLTTANYLGSRFQRKEFTGSAWVKVEELKKGSLAKAEDFPAWYKFKAPPMKHQVIALNKAWSRKEFAFFMEMRLGKTFTSINLACARAMDGQINALIVLCPTPIKPVWEWELEKFASIPIKVHVAESGNKKITEEFIGSATDEGFKILIVGIEALSQGSGYQLAERFAMAHNCMCIADESSRIKNPKSNRTDKAINIAGLCTYRAILTGTPTNQGIEDLYAQFYFLNWAIIGMKSYYSFMNRYCIMGGFEGRKIIGYDNVDELMSLISPYSIVIKAEDAIDLPEKVYEKRFVKPNKAQLTAIKDLQNSHLTESEGDVLETETVLDRLTRYQQIAGGNFPYEEDGETKIKPIPGKNPKMEEMALLFDEIQGKVIIWARFRPEIDLIVEMLTKKFGSSAVVEFHGGIAKEDRKEILQRFQTDEEVKFFVSNQQTGAMGIELSAASIHIFYSNDFSYDKRIQAEARTNSKNQKSNSILYIDLILDHKVDKMIHTAIRNKKTIADYVIGELKDDI